MGARSEVIVVLDSNVLISALITPGGTSDLIYAAWQGRRFELATCKEQIAEIRTASRHPKLAKRFPKHKAGSLLNEMGRSNLLTSVPRRYTATDPTDAFLLDLASAAGANYLVTGDRRAGLLERRRVEGTRILTPTEFCSTVLQLQL